MRKEFTMKRRDGTTAKFIFVKPKGSIWYWDLPESKKPVIFEGDVVSLPLPDVNLSKAKNLKDCLDLIAKKRGDDWVGQVVADILKCNKEQSQ